MAIKSMTLAAAVLAAAACHLDAVTEQPAVPPGNPDDQLRFFWGLDWRMYDSLPPAGFNMAIENSHGTFYYDMGKGEGRQGPMPDYEALADKMVRDDFIWNIQLRPFSQKHLHAKYPRTNKDGTQFSKSVDSTTPGCLDELRKYVEYHADVAARISAKTGCAVGFMPESEERIWTKPSFAPHNAAAYKAATGRDVPPEVVGRAAPHWSKLKDLPADRVVDKDHPLLSYYRWFWRDGEGSPHYYKMALDILREKLGYTPFSMYDPATREPPLWGTCGDVTHNNQWVTCYPYPYLHAYFVSEQNAFAEGCPGQRVVTMIQGIAASSIIAPTNDLPAKVPEWRQKNPNAVFVTPPPDLMLEQIWSAISRKVDGFGFHGWDCLWVLSDDYGRGRNYYRYTNPETRKMVERFMRDVAVPLGPILKAIPERPGEVAVLDTFASAILSGEGYWDWYRSAHGCGFLAEGANLAPVTLFEEAIEKSGIPDSVKVILASGQGVVTKETAAALKAFQARGGKIVADKSFVPAIKADAAIPSDDVVAVADDGDQEEVRADDMLPKEMQQTKDCMVRDRKWRARAAALAKICRQWAPAYVEADNQYIFLRTRTYGTADYVFAINDKRDFGDYVGPWRRIMDKGVPNEATIVVHRKAGAVYDLVRHKAVPFSVEGGKTLIPVKYETSDGRLLMVVDRPLGELKFRAEPADGGARVGVISHDKDVMIPIKVESATGKPFYGVVQGGKWIRTIKGHSADSVKVTNLADGREFGWKGPAVAPFASGERVTFLGDSITHGGRYCANLQLFWDLRFPGSGTRLMNCGVSGETAAGGVARWEYDVLPQRADRVFVMFGMNDVGHGNYDPKVKVDEKVEARRKGSVDGYRKNMAKIADLAQSAGKKLALITPTPYDEYGNLYTAERRPGCNSQGLAEIASACRELAKERKAEVVEFYSPLTEFVRGQDKYMFCRPDRVHPTNEGHIIMTALFLEAMGVSPFVAQVDMRADGRVEKSAGAKVSQVEAAPRGLSFRYEPGTLPFPVTDEYRKADEFYPVTAKMNVELLKVSGLPEGEYDLLADGAVLGTFSSRRFAEGVNLALLSTPAAKLALEAWGISRRLVAVQSRLRALVLTERKVNAKSTDDFEVVCAKMEKLVQDLKAKGVSTAGYYANNLETYRKDRQQIEQIRAEEDDIRRRLAEAAAKKASYVLTIRRKCD